MRRYYSYQKIATLYKKFQFHISAFALAVTGIWLGWKISKKPFIPEWLFFLLMIWAAVLAIELFRFIYIFKRRVKSNKK